MTKELNKKFKVYFLSAEMEQNDINKYYDEFKEKVKQLQKETNK